MKTKLIITILLVLAMTTNVDAQTAKSKQTVNATTSTTKKTPDVRIEYDELEDIYYIVDNKTEKVIAELDYKFVGEFSEGLAMFKQHYGLWGYINLFGKEVIPPIYDEVYNFYNDLAVVKLKNKWGIIDKTGKVVVQTKYEAMGIVVLIDTPIKVKLNNKWGFIDKTGKEVIPIIYDFADDFYGLKAKVILNGNTLYISQTGKEIK